MKAHDGTGKTEYAQPIQTTMLTPRTTNVQPYLHLQPNKPPNNAISSGPVAKMLYDINPLIQAFFCYKIPSAGCSSFSSLRPRRYYTCQSAHSLLSSIPLPRDAL